MRGGDRTGVAAVRQEAIAACGGLTAGQPGAVHDLLLRLSEHVPRYVFRHLSGILVHRTEAPEHPPSSTLATDLQRRGIAGQISGEAVLRVHYSLPSPPPLVSVIIPTRDGAAMLRQTIDGVMRRTDYPALEIIILDNGSTDAATLAYLAALAADPRVRVLPAPGPFNYSQLNNTGVAAARGEIILLLNNDMDVIGPGWLAEMVAHAVRPDVGAVGCKLLYADGTVQHAGIVTGMKGLAGHGFRGQDGAAPGYLGLLSCTRNVSAVTGACLAMRRDLYLSIGGLDADNLPVSYNDVDLCLRLDKAGYWIVWTPFASLYHLESVTRGADSKPENAGRAQREHDVLLRRWGERLLRDPYYSPCLTIDDESYGLAWPPRVAEPWRMADDP
jgi:GT2 family glycosyltransferase